MIDIFNSRENFTWHWHPRNTQGSKKMETRISYNCQGNQRSVYLGYFDWGRKIVGYGERFELSDDSMADLREIQKIYKGMDLKGFSRRVFRLYGWHLANKHNNS